MLGFGLAMTRRLTDWRRDVERNFRFDPTRGVEPRRISALDAEIATLKKKLEEELSSGPVELLKSDDKPNSGSQPSELSWSNVSSN